MTDPTEPTEFADLRVLVVDDQVHVQRWNQSVLSSLGITQVTLADSGKTAIAAVTAPGAAFDLIVCDLQMPDADGVETMRALASLGVEAGFIITSVEEARVIASAGMLAMQTGLRLLGQIPKPLTKEKLEPALAKLRELRDPAAASFTPSPDEVRAALDAKELFLVYQPKIDIRSGAFVGAEALVRWKHPEHGVVGPGTFIAVAETSDALIGRLTNFVLDEALTAVGHWREGGRDHAVSVNLPSRAFDVLDLPEHLEALVIKHRVDPKALTIEVSEAQLSVDTIRTRDVVTRLRLKRFGLALDNFGRGSSELSRLHQTPFTELKIAGEFVHGCATSAPKRSIVEASLALTRSLGVTSIAEGVADRDDWNLLETLGCQQAQGFFIARPMPEHGLEAWMAQWMLSHR